MRAALHPTLVCSFGSRLVDPPQQQPIGPSYHCDMPVISRFLGIAIAILYRDRDPPHFHGICGEFEITMTIRDGYARGESPRRARGLVLDGLQLHRDELLANWDRARRGEPLVPIPPLD